ncbi:hypothetical protein Dsin_009784 [Dipteronia sinensis]|uniref:Uncharacterized protein n=1 Tax=Dipteronia sinensis TaxID=43782 RepID=A0AAE0EC92_9ROSI|nr:hypothetical protein Dsin_009784 [Dipteronia sinensis]
MIFCAPGKKKNCRLFSRKLRSGLRRVSDVCEAYLTVDSLQLGGFLEKLKNSGVGFDFGLESPPLVCVIGKDIPLTKFVQAYNEAITVCGWKLPLKGLATKLCIVKMFQGQESLLSVYDLGKR